jgi:hypothetical protein
LDPLRSWGARSIPGGPSKNMETNERPLLRSFDPGVSRKILRPNPHKPIQGLPIGSGA